MIGINDIVHKVPAKVTIENVNQVVDSIHNFLPDCIVFIESVLPISSNKYSDSIKNLNEAYRRIAEISENCFFVDIYSSFFDECGNIKEGILSDDGVHLSGADYMIMISELSPYIYN